MIMTEKEWLGVKDIKLCDIPYAHNNLEEAKDLISFESNVILSEETKEELAQQVINFQKELKYDLTFENLLMEPISKTSYYRGANGIVYKKNNVALYVSQHVEGPYSEINYTQIVDATEILFRHLTKDEEANAQ